MENIKFEELQRKENNAVENNEITLSSHNISIYLEECLIILKFNLFESEKQSELAYKTLKILFETIPGNQKKKLKEFLLKVYDYSEIKDVNYFIKTLEKSGISYDIKAVSEKHWENQILIEYRGEIAKYKIDKSCSLNKLYNLILAVERGRGFYNFEFFLLIELIKLSDYKEIKKCYDESDDLIKIIMVNNYLTKSERLVLATESSNLLAKIEIVRKIDDYFLEEENQFIEIEDKEVYISIISELINDENWKEYLSFFIRINSCGLFLVLGEVFSSINKEKQLYIINNIKYQDLNKDYPYTFGEEKKCINLFKRIDELSSDVRESIAKSYFNEILKLEICLSLVFNNMTVNLLNMYNTFGCDLEQIRKRLDELEEIDNAWFEDSSEKTKTILKKYSCLFVLAAALVNEKEISSEKKQLLLRIEESFKKNIFEIKKENNGGFPLIETFRTYFLGKVK